MAKAANDGRKVMVTGATGYTGVAVLRPRGYRVLRNQRSHPCCGRGKWIATVISGDPRAVAEASRDGIDAPKLPLKSI
jgi:hypothetical protein